MLEARLFKRGRDEFGRDELCAGSPLGCFDKLESHVSIDRFMAMEAPVRLKSLDASR